MTRIRAISLAVLLASAAYAAPPKRPPSPNGKYVATAYSVSGKTASGEYTHRHILAADPDILPIGTRVRIRRAGRYSGEYVVADTGEKIVGRKIDIYIPNAVEAKKFGRKVVRLKVIELGKGTAASAKEAVQAVKKEVAKDVEQGAVGRAATEADWAAKKNAEAKPNSPETAPH